MNIIMKPGIIQADIIESTGLSYSTNGIMAEEFNEVGVTTGLLDTTTMPSIYTIVFKLVPSQNRTEILKIGNIVISFDKKLYINQEQFELEKYNSLIITRDTATTMYLNNINIYSSNDNVGELYTDKIKLFNRILDSSELSIEHNVCVGNIIQKNNAVYVSEFQEIR